MMDISEALAELTRITREAEEAIRKMVESVKEDAEKEISERRKFMGIIPPRRSNSRARSPCVNRYWINYKARDKLVSKRLKTGRKRTCQGKRNVSRMR